MRGDLFKAMQTAIKLEQARDSVRGLFGDDYDAKIGPLASELKSLAEREGSSVLSVAIRAAKQAQQEGNPHFALMVLAAAADAAEGVPVNEARR